MFRLNRRIVAVSCSVLGVVLLIGGTALNILLHRQGLACLLASVGVVMILGSAFYSSFVLRRRMKP